MLIKANIKPGTTFIAAIGTMFIMAALNIALYSMWAWAGVKMLAWAIPIIKKAALS